MLKGTNVPEAGNQAVMALDGKATPGRQGDLERVAAQSKKEKEEVNLSGVRPSEFTGSAGRHGSSQSSDQGGWGLVTSPDTGIAEVKLCLGWGVGWRFRL